MTREQAAEIIRAMGYGEDDTHNLLSKAVAGNGRRIDLGRGRWVRYEVRGAAWDRRGGYSLSSQRERNN